MSLTESYFRLACWSTWPGHDRTKARWAGVKLQEQLAYANTSQAFTGPVGVGRRRGKPGRKSKSLGVQIMAKDEMEGWVKAEEIIFLEQAAPRKCNPDPFHNGLGHGRA
jgi:hypothetical protein